MACSPEVLRKGREKLTEEETMYLPYDYVSFIIHTETWYFVTFFAQLKCTKCGCLMCLKWLVINDSGTGLKESKMVSILRMNTLKNIMLENLYFLVVISKNHQCVAAITYGIYEMVWAYSVSVKFTSDTIIFSKF